MRCSRAGLRVSGKKQVFRDILEVEVHVDIGSLGIMGQPWRSSGKAGTPLLVIRASRPFTLEASAGTAFRANATFCEGPDETHDARGWNR